MIRIQVWPALFFNPVDPDPCISQGLDPNLLRRNWIRSPATSGKNKFRVYWFTCVRGELMAIILDGN